MAEELLYRGALELYKNNEINAGEELAHNWLDISIQEKK